jgi:hypothetical protein
MKEWHFEHMQKTIVKYVAGLPYADNNSKLKKDNITSILVI